LRYIFGVVLLEVETIFGN